MEPSWIEGAVLRTLLGPLAARGKPDIVPRMPLQSFVDTIEQRHAQSPDPLHAWSAGTSVDLNDMGLLGGAIGAARTLGEALRTYARGFSLLQTGSRLEVEVIGSEAHVTYRVLDPRIWPRRADSELSLGLIYGICRQYGVPAGAIRELNFEHGRDRHHQAMASALPYPPRYDQGANSITLSAKVLANRRTRLSVVDPRPLLKDLDRALVTMRQQASLSGRIHELLLAEMADGLINQGDIADRVGMSERSIRRLLAQEGQSFHEILAEVRRIHGFALITRSHRALGEIALMLGYADQASFSRAFSRWYGFPPKDLRKQAQSGVMT